MVPEGEDLISRAKQYEQFLQAVQVPYWVNRTKSTIEVIPYEGLSRVKWVRKGLSVTDARFIQKVKRHFSSMELPKRIRPIAGSTHYFQNYVNVAQGLYDKYVEIDVSAAYWKTALNLGYIDEELYREGMEASKVCRLVALGSLAKKTEACFYAPPDYELSDIRVLTPETAVYWDNITFSFSLVITQIAGLFKGKILGFWVDAVFVDASVSAEVREAFQEAGYDVKLVRWDKIEVLDLGMNRLQIIREGRGERKELPPFVPGRIEGAKSLKAALEEMEEILRRDLGRQPKKR